MRVWILALGAVVACGKSSLDEFNPIDTGTKRDFDPPGGDDTGESVEVDTEDTGPEDTGPEDTGTSPPPDPCQGLTRAMCFVRTQPMMLSGLVVSMDAPPAEEVHRFFDDFGANTVQFWADGLPTEVSQWAGIGRSDFQWISWVDASGMSYDNSQFLGGGSLPSGRLAYQVGDEPRTLEELHGNNVGVEAIRAQDPDALIIMNFGNGETESERDLMLEHYASSMDGDILSYDQYGFHYSSYLHMERTRAVALKYGKPYWRYLNSYADGGKPQNWPESTDMRWDALRGLLYGYTGHTWFLYQTSKPHNLITPFFNETGSWQSGQRDAFHTVSQLNRELAILGKTVTQLTSTDVRFSPEVELYSPKGTTPWSKGAGGDPYITAVAPQGLYSWEFQDTLIGFFEDDAGEIYVMLQNPTHDSAEWPIMVEDSCDFQIRFDFAGAPSSLNPNQVQVLDHKTGKVVTRALTNLGGNQRSLDVLLDAGDVIFFKYDTGQPFVGQ